MFKGMNVFRQGATPVAAPVGHQVPADGRALHLYPTGAIFLHYEEVSWEPSDT